MTRKKKTAGARNAAQRSCYHLLQPREGNTPFLTFMRSLGNDIMTNEPPPGQNQPMVDRSVQIGQRFRYHAKFSASNPMA